MVKRKNRDNEVLGFQGMHATKELSLPFGEVFKGELTYDQVYRGNLTQEQELIKKRKIKEYTENQLN